MLRLGRLALAATLIGPVSAAAQPENSDEAAPEIVVVQPRAPFAASAARSEQMVPLTQFSTALEAQKELRRVGCYEGETNGIWSKSSQSAAQRFVDRVNAKLPTDKPDEVLLALLRDQAAVVCKQCQPDQAPDAAGRCMPAALVNNKSPRARSATPAPVSEASSPERPPGDRMQAAADLEQASARRRAPSQTEPGAAKSWQSFIRKVDRALGLY